MYRSRGVWNPEFKNWGNMITEYNANVINLDSVIFRTT